MKTSLVAASLLATLSLAANTPAQSQQASQGLRNDSAQQSAFGLHRDSLQLPSLPDSLKTKIEQQLKAFEAKKAECGKDSAKNIELKVSIDSLRKIWEAKRDTQVANIQDTAVRAKVEARIEKVAEHKAVVKAKVEAKKAKIEAKKAEATTK
jgi:hypothetical protein